MVRSEPGAASGARPAVGPDGQVAAAAVEAVATVNAPAAMRATALDRLDGIVRCRDKGTFRWFARHAICVTPDRGCHGNGGRHLRVRRGAGQGAGLTPGSHHTDGVLSAIHHA
jgi:hypothetical protein